MIMSNTTSQSVSRTVKNTLLLLAYSILPMILGAQEYHVLTSDYIVIEKSSASNAISMDRGIVTFDSREENLNYRSTNKASLSIDTEDLSIVNDAQEMDLEAFQQFNEVAIFNYILDSKRVDHGMKHLGFKSNSIGKDEDGLVITWNAPASCSHIVKKVLTKIADGKMDRVEYFDSGDKLIAEVLFEDYGSGVDENRPIRIKSSYFIEDKVIDRILKLERFVLESPKL